MRSAVLVVVGGFAFAMGARARADSYSVHAILDGDVAATDNVFSTPSGGLGTTPHESDIYVQIRPGVLLAYDTPRMVQELTAQLEILEYVRNNNSPSLTARGNWQAFYEPTPFTELTTTVDGSTGTVNALTARTSPDQTASVAVPPGNVDIDQVDAGEHLVHTITREVRIVENAVVRYATTDDNVGDTTDAFEADGALTLERVWRSSSLGIEGGLSYLRFDRSSMVPDLTGFDRDHELNPHAYGVARHDFSRHWTANINGGAVWVIPTLHDRANQTFPVAAGQIGYTNDWGSAALQGGRAIAADQFIAENTVSDSVSATVSLPLPWLRATGQIPALVGQGSVGYSRTQLVNSMTGSLASSFDIEHADVGVTWVVKPGMTIGARYEYVRQTGDALKPMLLPGFDRSTLFFTFAIRLPPRTAGEVPRRTGMRADGRDLTPVGDEVVVPETAAPSADGTSDGGPGPQTP